MKVLIPILIGLLVVGCGKQGMVSRGNDPLRLATKTTRPFPATTYNTYKRLCAALQTLD